MKNDNLPATRRRVAITAKILLSFSLLGLVSLFNGCALAPSAVDSFVFHAETNTVPVVTNWVKTVTVTNSTGGAETRNVVTWATNIENHVTYTVSTNAAAIVKTGAAVGNIFAPGWGEAVGVGLMGLFGLWAKMRTAKTTKSAAVMAQGMETLLALIEAEKGKAFTDTLKLRLVKDQNAAGVLREIAKLVETTVDNEAAKQLARSLLESLPAAQTPAP